MKRDMETEQERIFGALRAFFDSGRTLDPEFRLGRLTALRDAIVRHEDDIAAALAADLHKSPEESWISETSVLLADLRAQMRAVRRTARPRRVPTPLSLFPSRSLVARQPKGVVYIMAPWNYPILLTLGPLAGAVAAGNCAGVKPSTTSRASFRTICEIISEAFGQEHVAVCDGGHDQAERFLDMPFDHFFFTGGAAFGRHVACKAAGHLATATLELGGKSPCVVDETADLPAAARRIVWGKLLNAGQTCIAPDYVLVHRAVCDRFVEELCRAVERFYGHDPHSASHYPRIVSEKAFDRLEGYLDGPGRIVLGGERRREELYIAPTVILDPDPSSPLMREEIFGPLLPVLAVGDMKEAASFIAGRDTPLALYFFGRRSDGLRFADGVPSGGACINDTVVHVANHRLPFGGRGASGMGRYHGEWSIDTFSHLRATVVSPRKHDMALRYPPYGRRRFALLKRLTSL